MLFESKLAWNRGTQYNTSGSLAYLVGTILLLRLKIANL